MSEGDTGRTPVEPPIPRVMLTDRRIEAEAGLTARTGRVRGDRRVLRALLLIIGACFLLMQVRDLLSYSQWWTDEDQTLLWFAGSGLIHGQLHSPNVLGANYNTVFEAFPGAVLHGLGVTLRMASPTGVASMATGAWLLLAGAAYRRRNVVSAALALALPVCLSLKYLLAYDQLKGVQTGDLLAAGAIAASIAVNKPLPKLALMVVLAGVGFVWDNASVVATGPALLAAVGADFGELKRRPGRSLAVFGGAVLTPLALVAFNHFWYAAHPGYIVSPPVPTALMPSVLVGHLDHPGPLLGAYAPELLRSPWIALAWVVGVPICAAAVWWRTRRVEPGLAALGFAGVLLVLLSVADTRANFRPDIYLTGARFMFLMPMGAWVVVHHTLATLRDAPRDFRSGKTLSHRLRIPSAAAMSVIAVCTLASTAVAQASFRSQVKPLIAFGLGPGAGVQMQDASELLSECATVTGLYRKYRAQVLVSLDQPFAYGCAAQSGLNTLFPPFERRPWLVKAARNRKVDRILLWGGINCQPTPPLSPKVGVCTPLPAGAELLVTPPRSVAATLAVMGVRVYRPNLRAAGPRQSSR